MRFLVLLSCITIYSLGFSQSERVRARSEFGVYGGGSYYIGDLNSSKHFIYSKPAFGLIYRYNLGYRASVRLTGTYGNVWAEDSRASDPFQVNRNLSFKSKLYEVAFGVEVNMFKYSIASMRNPITPYFFYELAYMRMNPQTDHNGNEIDLQSFGTEGQGTSLNQKGPYSLNQISMPLGIGVKFNIVKRLALSIEYGIRKTFTDYLDDVSGNYVDVDLLTAENGPLAGELSNPSLDGVNRAGFNRGNSSTKDWYVFYGAMLTFKPFKKDVCAMGRGF
ncbi:MAG: hypothetical protein ACI857_001087 [Arenicella sp.]|jgi:hypothetical protein